MSTYPPAILQCANPICITDAILSKHVTSIICYSRRTVQVIHSAPFKLFTAHCSSYSQCTVQVIHSTPFKLLKCTIQVIHSAPFKLFTAHRSSYSQRTVQVIHSAPFKLFTAHHSSTPEIRVLLQSPVEGTVP